MKTHNGCSASRPFQIIQIFMLIFIFFLSCTFPGSGRIRAGEASSAESSDSFIVCADHQPVPLVCSTEDYPGVARVLQYFQSDIEQVTGIKPEILNSILPETKKAIIIGTLGKSPLIDRLSENGKIQTGDIEGKWESTLIQVVNNPAKGLDQALVIAGSDKRGTIYGMFDISSEIGVSPWTWWADVPVKQRADVSVQGGRRILGEPKVKYRGIFLNDEEPALGRWAVENYGGFNAQFYEKVFELILRLKGNFLWPAMWWAAFNANDPENPRLADELGIVMSTSHHEPMMRAHAEWRPYGGGAWNYETNAEQLRKFWKEGIERMGNYESVVTLAMRGDGDMAMSEGTNIALLETIVEDQREILADVTGRDVTTIPQVWALYKEVQDYYDKGMRVPDDVTLLLCDDNWGNVRRLPRPGDPKRAGGYGMYYHFDFVGGPVSYKWLNTNPLARIWEQMHLCYQHGVDRIWLVNVGDLKPMEFPISFFLDYAWNPDALPAEQLPDYTRQWAEQQFGSEYASEIADILTQYTKFNGRRTPEMLKPDTYSLIHYREAERIVAEYNQLAEKASRISQQLPESCHDAFYQLVLHPVTACANLNELYLTVGKNRLYAEQGRAATNDLADRAEALFEKDAEITRYYHTTLADGKWNNMMNQTHIGYTSWNDPPVNIMPEVRRIESRPEAEMGLAIEGSVSWWPDEKEKPVLPEFNKYTQDPHYFEIFNRGEGAITYQASSKAPWLIISPAKATVEKERRIWVRVDWEKAPQGTQHASIEIQGPSVDPMEVQIVAHNPQWPKRDTVQGFVESEGVVSMEAEHFSRAVHSQEIRWLRIPDMGRTLSGITVMPVTAGRVHPGDASPRLEYDMHFFSAGEVEVQVFVSPTQDYNDTGGLHYGISFDDDPVQMVNIHVNDTIPDWKYPATWNEAVGNSIKVLSSTHRIEKPGPHVLKYWMADPGIVLQKIVVNAGGLKPSYLGPPESYYRYEE